MKQEHPRKGSGSRKGGRVLGKQRWIIGIRKIRSQLLELRDRKLITTPVFRRLFLMAKGGSFRSISHLNEYVETHKLVKRR